MSLTVISPVMRPSESTIGSFSILCRCRISSASRSVVPCGAVTSPRSVINSETGRVSSRWKPQVAVRQDPDEQPVGVGDRNAGDAVPRHQLERVSDERARGQRPPAP
jgi:hypothetical protein